MATRAKLRQPKRQNLDTFKVPVDLFVRDVLGIDTVFDEIQELS